MSIEQIDNPTETIPNLESLMNQVDDRITEWVDLISDIPRVSAFCETHNKALSLFCDSSKSWLIDVVKKNNIIPKIS